MPGGARARRRAAAGARALATCLALGWALSAPPAAAELFRCQGPDGRTVFTDQKGRCPDAEEFEPAGRVHSADPAPAVQGPAARERGRLAAEAEEAQAREWRRRRVEAEEAIAAIQRRREELRPSVSHCNRGGYIVVRDEAGIKRRLNCTVLRRDFAALEEQEAAARSYLAEGLAEECRKAGCLPGWIR